MMRGGMIVVLINRENSLCLAGCPQGEGGLRKLSHNTISQNRFLTGRIQMLRFRFGKCRCLTFICLSKSFGSEKP
jgi:hypothetical protein